MMGNSHVTYKCLENAGKYGLETIEEIRSYLQAGNMESPQTEFVCGFFCETDYDILILNRKRMEELSNARNFIVLWNTSNHVS